ncbi:flagellin [Pelagibacterium montanilacus]|uniref:flagellin N-terminal helical domain-containing protein n=1 Tax=Pelagibacterium montanilacus TaxID=2185280 RepID=UPI000F8DF51B|nr:flagellin [Pelagibacterium montanilacus]
MDVNLSKAVRSNLLSLQNTATMMGKTQERLATGLKVNSALDNPTNFFTASGLKSRAGDLGQLMDSVSNAIQTIQAADKGISAMTKLVESAQATARQALQTSATVEGTTGGSPATGASITAGTFSTVDLSGAGSPAQAAEITGSSFTEVNVGQEAEAATLSSTSFGTFDVSDGGDSFTFDISLDSGTSYSIDVSDAAVDAYNLDNTGDTIAANSLDAESLSKLINYQIGEQASGAPVEAEAGFAGGELTISSIAQSDAASVTIENLTDNISTGGGDLGIANNATDTGVTADSISFTLDVDGDQTNIDISAASVADYNLNSGNPAIDASALAGDDVAALINYQTNSSVASFDGSGLTLTGADGDAASIEISSFDATNVTAGDIGLGLATGSGQDAVAADSISFSLSVDGDTTAVTIDAATVNTYNTDNGTSFDASALTAENIATLINDQAGAEVATVDAGALTFASGTTGTGSTVDISGYSAGVSGGSTGIADATDAGDAEVAGTPGTVANPKRAELVDQYNELLQQIDDLAKDASFNGVNLLNGNDLQVIFNEDGSSKLDITGVEFDSAGLGLTELSGSAFNDNDGINAVLNDLKSGIEDLRTQASKFGSNLSVVETRQNFTKDMVNVLETGAANLTLADTNEEAANLLALQTRQQLSSTALSMASQADQSVLRLF